MSWMFWSAGVLMFFCVELVAWFVFEGRSRLFHLPLSKKILYLYFQGMYHFILIVDAGWVSLRLDFIKVAQKSLHINDQFYNSGWSTTPFRSVLGCKSSQSQRATTDDIGSPAAWRARAPRRVHVRATSEEMGSSDFSHVLHHCNKHYNKALFYLLKTRIR
jgi:hypothetical protein